VTWRRCALPGLFLAVLPGLAAAAVVLDGPLVVKLSWSSRAAMPCDLDGDGRTDLALINNEHARIDLLYQRRPGEDNPRTRTTGVERWQPVLSDAPFRRQTAPTGIRCFDLAVADLDGDGRQDLVYTGRPDGLTVRYQDRRSRFDRSRVLSDEAAVTWAGTLVADDLDGDTRADLAVLMDGVLLVYRQAADGGMTGPDRYLVAGDGRFGLRALDADGDGRTDLLYQVGSGDHTVRLRRGLGGARFGAEQAFPLKVSRKLVWPIGGSGETRLARITGAGGVVETLDLVRRDQDVFRLDGLSPRVLAAHRSDGAGNAVYAVGDFDGDGRTDIAVASPANASMVVLLHDTEGEFVRSSDFPGVASVRAAAAGDLDADGRDDLVVASASEEVVAWSRLGASGRLEYPSPLPIEGEPFGVVAADLDGNGTVDVAAAVEQGSERSVVVLQGDGTGQGWTSREVPLEGLRVPPRALGVVDADQDGRLDLAVFTARDPIRLLLNRSDGTFEPAAELAGFQRGLLDNVAPSAFTTGDVDGDGREEMLVASGAFARALRLSAEGRLEVVDQFNARSSETTVGAAAVWDPDGDGDDDVVLVHDDGGMVELLRRGRDSVFRYSESMTAHPIDVQRVEVLDLATGGGRDLLLFGASAITWLAVGGDELALHSTAIYETDLDDVEHDLLATGDLGSGPGAEIVLIDSEGSRVLEILGQDEDGEWHSVLHFTIFEADPHYEGQQGSQSEPREVVVADVTDDGRDDLILLVHDRLLVYPQG
jgi:hypothetical protein